jgi:hypothetical protein
MSPEITLEKMKECLIPVALIDPTNNEYIKLISDVEKIIADKKAKADEEFSYQSQIEALKKFSKKRKRFKLMVFHIRPSKPIRQLSLLNATRSR